MIRDFGSKSDAGSRHTKRNNRCGLRLRLDDGVLVLEVEVEVEVEEPREISRTCTSTTTMTRDGHSMIFRDKLTRC